MTDTKDFIICIGASTGGTEAIIKVVKDLPIDTPPILITQHMPEVFTQMYAQRLDKICKMSASEAKNGEMLKKGHIYIAPGGDKHMSVVKVADNLTIRLFKKEHPLGHTPSVDVLFTSVAKVCKDKAVGVILTGMGQDGAAGLLLLKKAGAYTIGQDEKSCIVYGMPKVAFEIGAVTKQADCSFIGGMIIKLLKEKSIIK